MHISILNQNNVQNENDNVPKQIKKQNINYYILLSLLGLNFNTGIIGAYYLSSINVLLTKKNASFSSLSNLFIPNFIFLLKVPISIFCDIYYFSILGKRKTYIIISNVFAILFSSFYIDSWIENLDTWNITIIALFLNFFISIQSIAVDVWPRDFNIEKKGGTSKAGFLLSFGQKLGILVGYNLFIFLNSTEKISNQSFTLGIAISMVFILIFVCVSTRESSIETEPKPFIFESLKIYFKDHNLRWLMFYTLILGSGLSLIESGPETMLKKGFSATKLDLIDLIVLCSAAILGIISIKLAKTRKELTIILITYGLSIIFNSIYLGFMYNYDDLEENLKVIIISFVNFTSSILHTIRLILYYSFFSRIKNKNINSGISAFHVVFMLSIMNLSNFFNSWISIFLYEYYSFGDLGIAGVIVASIILICSIYKILPLEREFNKKEETNNSREIIENN